METLHHSEPMHIMRLAEWTGWIAPREKRESLTYKLRTLFGGVKTNGSPQIKRLEKDGSILGYRAVVNPSLLDLGQVMFVQVALRDTSKETRDSFTRAVHAIGEIETCHMITGDFHYMLTIRTRSVDAFQGLLTEQIAQLPAVARTTTIIAMKTIKTR